MKRIHISIILALCMISSACAQKNEKKEILVRNTTEIHSDTVAIVREKAEKGDSEAQFTLANWYLKGYNSVKKDNAEAVRWLAKAMKQEHVGAMREMAVCYQFGRGLSADSLAAVKLYKAALSKGDSTIIPMHHHWLKNNKNAFSAMLLRDIYAEGIGIKTDKGKADDYFRQAAEIGDKNVQFDFAQYAYNTKKYDLSALFFKKAADKGHSVAAYLYGLQLFQGKGTVQDKQKGIEYLKKAAEGESYMADYELGRIALEGDGVENNAEEAVKHLRKAAPRYKKAAWLLGNCYKDGTGVGKDFYFATQWISESLGDDKESRQRVEKMLDDDNDGAFTQYLRGLYRYNIDKNYGQAITFFEKVEKAKVADGFTMHAVCMANKGYEKRNEKKAVKLLTKAAASNPVAQYYLSSMYASGTGVKKDNAKAVELLTKAADSGVGYAQCALADRLMEGDGVIKDISKAARLYLKAEAQHRLTNNAARNLAKCYQFKVGVLPDLKDAEKRVKALNGYKETSRLNMLLAKISFR